MIVGLKSKIMHIPVALSIAHRLLCFQRLIHLTKYMGVDHVNEPHSASKDQTKSITNEGLLNCKSSPSHSKEGDEGFIHTHTHHGIFKKIISY